MGKMTESKKRDFVSQLVVIMEQNEQLLTDKGFNPQEKIAALKQEMTDADAAEARQREAAAAAKDATRTAQQTLDVAYTNASATVDLITGLLGKKDNLVLEIKKLRNTERRPRSPREASE
ncbi:hypothetical protein D1164_20270 [Mariniphaga sediminis]|uniref:Uncharacterized protein n=1 Tax=Mariniphaga sediminis TaxID=1628158 RepID=A0A399CTV3_9BACT|nr:hypothetical protein [Mariniphaga sediminis]RIH63325.1 hypothetical protein D1164_20270 [Mariniphaga sediminis]